MWDQSEGGWTSTASWTLPSRVRALSLGLPINIAEAQSCPPSLLQVNKVTWAHPQFGSIIASCSADRNVVVWEEQDKIDGQSANMSQTQAVWRMQATLTNSGKEIKDIAFAPSHLGLQLAAGSEVGPDHEFCPGPQVSHVLKPDLACCSAPMGLCSADRGGPVCGVWVRRTDGSASMRQRTS